jgi:hypothetical protein
VTTNVDQARYAAALARTVELLRRSTEPGEPQKAALRALVATAAERSATIRYYDNTLTIDSVEVATVDPRLAAFGERLKAQNVAEIVIARGAEPTELLALASALAAEPGHGRLKEKLRDAASTRVMVVAHQSVDPGHRTVSVTGAFQKVKLDEAVLSEWNKFLNHGATAQPDTEVNLGFKAQHTGEMQINMDPAPGVPMASTSANDPKIIPLPPAGLASPPTLQAASPMGIGLAKVLADPYGADVLSRLTQLARHIEDGFSRDGVAEAIDAVNTLVEVEAQAPNTTVRGTYNVILGRILTRTALARVAPYLMEPRRRQRAAVNLRRGGEVSTGLLVQLVADAHTLGERMLYVDVLREIPNGTDKLLALLSSRNEWQMARNIAELMGEARIENSVPYLARLIDDPSDDRVRRAALVAMARIGSGATIEPLRTVLKSGAPELRALIAQSVVGPHARALTAPLAAAAAEEENADVARALVKAVARIGTPEAKQALERTAALKTMFSRKGKAAKEAAEEALRTFVAAPVR